MASFNEIHLLGNLGKDPIAVANKSATTICNFSVATKHTYKDANGQQQDETSWHSIVVFGKRADACIKYLSKGSAVYVVGRLRYRKYKDKQGTERMSAEVVADVVQFLSGGKTRASNAQPAAQEASYEDEPF